MKQKGSVDFLLRQQKVEKMDFYALAKFWGVEEPQDKEAGWCSETSRITEKEKIQMWYEPEMGAESLTHWIIHLKNIKWAFTIF